MINEIKIFSNNIKVYLLNIFTRSQRYYLITKTIKKKYNNLIKRKMKDIQSLIINKTKIE
jgi:hypothetical protein